MLVSISYDSLSRNALRCGIDAKVRSKNECASKKREKIHQLIRKAGISERNTRFWRMKSILHVAWHTDETDWTDDHRFLFGYAVLGARR